MGSESVRKETPANIETSVRGRTLARDKRGRHELEPTRRSTHMDKEPTQHIHTILMAYTPCVALFVGEHIMEGRSF